MIGNGEGFLDRVASLAEWLPVLRYVGLLLVCTIAYASLAGVAGADGDPASDILVEENVYLPYQTPSAAASAGLGRQVAGVYASGGRIKVAVIAAKSDLGAIPSLFGKQADYAAFLGDELSGVYVGPLLVVMPSGFGIYDGGRSVASEQAVLQQLAAPGSSRSTDLVAAATAAVADLSKAGALASTDILKPEVGMYGGKYSAGKLTIRFYVYDDSGRAALSVTATRAGSVLFSGAIRSVSSSYTRVEKRTFRIHPRVSLRGARLCLSAVDATGNRSGMSCRTIH